MSTLLSQLGVGGNPFATVVGQRIGLLFMYLFFFMSITFKNIFNEEIIRKLNLNNTYLLKIFTKVAYL